MPSSTIQIRAVRVHPSFYFFGFYALFSWINCTVQNLHYIFMGFYVPMSHSITFNLIWVPNCIIFFSFKESEMIFLRALWLIITCKIFWMLMHLMLPNAFQNWKYITQNFLIVTWPFPLLLYFWHSISLKKC